MGVRQGMAVERNQEGGRRMKHSMQDEEALFEAARQLKAGGPREAFLAQACAGDTELQRRLEDLLTANEVADNFLKSASRSAGSLFTSSKSKLSAADKMVEEIADEQIGQRIGPYKILQRIGEGGGGVVYMAEQEKPISRRVALKIIKLGMDTKSVIARFDAERQALALMDHPNIARVLDAGVTETGRPYFVMELVRGVRITEYCDQNNLDTWRRLELFIQICSAIQHAHQKGIIHRDIKPSNILVTMHDGVPVPKVIDFGIAKAVEGRLTEQTLFTAYEQIIGTPAYMSPEQAEMSGLDVDTRSDIYSLGVLLYELLTGRTPFDAKELVKSGLEEMRRTLREREPQRPSSILTTLHGTELTTTAAHRHMEPPKLISTLKGDLDWIVMKTLEKDRKRRYETANGLSMDVQRYLKNEPVTARPPSRAYRLQKLVRRNQVVFASGAAVVVALVSGLGISTRLFIEERQALQRAVAAEQNEFALRQQSELREKITQMALMVSREEYNQADDLLAKTPFDQPSLEGAVVLRTLGEWHAREDRWPQAANRFERLMRVDGIDGLDVQTLDCLQYGPALIEAGDLAGYDRFRRAAVAHYEDTNLPVADRILKIALLLPGDRELLNSLAPVADTTQRTFNEDKGSSEPDPFRAAWQCVSLALMEYRRGNYTNSADWAHQCLAYPEFNAPRTATAHILLAMAHWQQGQKQQADTELTEGQDAVALKFEAGLDHGSAPDGFWFDWVFARILLREAQGLIRSPTTPSSILPSTTR
jgi:serine/threonine protein kinase